VTDRGDSKPERLACGFARRVKRQHTQFLAAGRPAGRTISFDEVQSDTALRIGDGTMDWREHVAIDPAVCPGQACIKGTRIMVAVVLDNLAAGLATDEILRSYPSLTAEDVRAPLAYGAEVVRKRLGPLGA